jgi:hypothetical protein
VTPADPTLNALLAATATEDWPAWYGCTRLAVADYLEERDLPGDRQAAGLVRQARPTAWAQCPVRPGWEVEEVRLARAGDPARWRPYDASKLVTVSGRGPGDDAWSALADCYLWPGEPAAVGGHLLRPFPLRALRLSAVILDESEVSAGVTLGQADPRTTARRYSDLKLTPWDARLWCRREVLGLFPDVTVKAPCPYCEGRGITPTGFLVHAAVAHGASLKPGTVVGTPGGPLRCPVCRGRPPRPCPAPSLLPTLPAVALPAPAPLN